HVAIHSHKSHMSLAALRRCQQWLIALAVGLIVASAATADIFVLESGGRVEGEWLNREEQPLTTYAVLRSGVTLTLPASIVRETIRQSPAELEYSKLGPTAADTVE